MRTSPKSSAAQNKKEITLKAGDRRWTFVLSAIINILLIAILAGPWIWAYFWASDKETPGHYLENMFHSIRLREEESWHKLIGPETNGESGHKNVNQALDRIETALKKPVIDRAEIHNAIEDIKAAEHEMKKDVSNWASHKREEAPAKVTP